MVSNVPGKRGNPPFPHLVLRWIFQWERRHEARICGLRMVLERTSRFPVFCFRTGTACACLEGRGTRCCGQLWIPSDSLHPTWTALCSTDGENWNRIFSPFSNNWRNTGIRFAAASGRQYDGLRKTFSPVADRMLFIAKTEPMWPMAGMNGWWRTWRGRPPRR